MPDDTKRKPEDSIRPGTRFSPVSGVKLSVKLTSDVDAWAEAHSTSRSDALRQLIELGLSRPFGDNSSGSVPRNPVEIENMAVRQIDQLIDPSLPATERERRIRRLTEGPPEFLNQRIDLPKPKK